MAEYSLAELARSGIYEIVNTINGKRYVGSAVSIALRWRQHRCELGKGRHNPKFQNAWLKYGADAFVFRVLEYVGDKQDLLSREQIYIDALNPEYNCAKVAGSNLGIQWGPQTLAKMSAASLRLWSTAGHKERMSAAHRGQILTAEHRAKISAANTGKKLSEAHAEKVAATNAARNKTLEHRALMSAYWKGRPKPAEQVEKMAASKRGKPLSLEHRAKLAAAGRLAALEGRHGYDRSKEICEQIGRSLATLTDDQVREIRSRRKAGVKQKELSAAYGVSQSGISNICSGKTYQWV